MRLINNVEDIAIESSPETRVELVVEQCSFDLSILLLDRYRLYMGSATQ